MSRFAAAGLCLLIAQAAAAEDLLPPQIIHEPCDNYQTGKAFTIRAQFYDDSALFDPKVVYRTKRTTEWRSLAFKKSEDADFVVTIKARELRGALEYFIETFDENGNGPARYGSPEAPVRVLPSNEEQDCQQTGAVLGPLKTYDTSKDEPAKPPRAPAKAPETKASEPPPAKTADPRATTPAQPQHTGPQPLPDGADQVIKFSEPPPPAKEGCALDDPPAYCSAWLWVGLAAGVVAAGGIGFGVWWAVEGQGAPPGPIERVNLQIGGGNPIGPVPSP